MFGLDIRILYETASFNQVSLFTFFSVKRYCSILSVQNRSDHDRTMVWPRSNRARTTIGLRPDKGRPMFGPQSDNVKNIFLRISLKWLFFGFLFRVFILYLIRTELNVAVSCSPLIKSFDHYSWQSEWTFLVSVRINHC